MAPAAIDGVAKVTGAKLYASDFRAADLPGWPQSTSHAILVRAPDATHVYTGMDLARLSGALKPSVVVTAADLDKIGTRVPEFYTGDLFCPVGKTPIYMGQPVALLIFETFDAFDQARLALRDGTFVKFGEETGPVALPNYGAYRFTRVAGATPDAPDVYSPIQAGWVSPGRSQNSPLPVWSPLAKDTPAPYCQGRGPWRADPRELAAKNPNLLVLDREFETQSVDPMFLEPEAGLAWYNSKKRKPRTRARRAVALRGRRVDRVSARQGPRAVQAGAHQRPVHLCRRRLRRARPHAVRALRGAGGDVLSRPSGPAGA